MTDNVFSDLPSAEVYPDGGYRITLNEGQLEDLLLTNATLMSRQDLLKRILDPRTDINKECGFPDEPKIEDYRMLYDREPLAARVVQLFPQECWQLQPQVYEDEDPETVTAFEEAWDNIGIQLRGGKSWYNKEQGSPVWEMLSRVDELSGIGTFGGILLGFDDGEDFSQPVKYKKGMKLLYARALDERLCQVASFENDKAHPRYGKPNSYNVTLVDFTQDAGPATTGAIPIQGTATMTAIHHTRVIHVADLHHQASSSEIFAVPRMRPVLNNLMGLRKLYASSPEGYWKACFHILSLETNPALGGDVRVNKTAIRNQLEQLRTGLQRELILSGLTAKSIAPSLTDLTPHVKAQIDAICIKMGVPNRIFIGSERGELASGQDDSSWNDRIRARQSNYITPRIIVPFVDRLIEVGVLPEPVEGYFVKWPDLDTPDAQKRAQVFLTMVQAIVAYVQGGAENLIAPMSLLTRLGGMTDEEATSVLEEAQEHLEEARPEEDVLAGHGPLSFPEEELPPEEEAPGTPPTENQEDEWEVEDDIYDIPIVENCGGKGGKPGPCKVNLKTVTRKGKDYRKLTGTQKEQVLTRELDGVAAIGGFYRSVKTPGYKNLSVEKQVTNKQIGMLEGTARAYVNQADQLSGKDRRVYLHMALDLYEKAQKLHETVMKGKVKQ